MDPVLSQKIKDLEARFNQQKAEYETQLKEYSKDTYCVEKTNTNIHGERVHIRSYLSKKPIDMQNRYILIDAIKELIAKITADEEPIERFIIYKDTSISYGDMALHVTKLSNCYKVYYDGNMWEDYSVSKNNMLKILNDILEMPMPQKSN